MLTFTTLFIFKVGRRSLEHNGKKVVSFNKSIQGQWRPGLFDFAPKHTMLHFKGVPSEDMDEKTMIDRGLIRKKNTRHPKHSSTLYTKFKVSKPDHMTYLATD